MTISLCFRRVIISLFQSVGCLALKRNASAPNRNGRPHKPHSSGHGSGRKLILKAKTLCYLFIAVFVCPVRKECGKLLRGPSRFRCTTNIARCNPWEPCFFVSEPKGKDSRAYFYRRIDRAQTDDPAATVHRSRQHPSFLWRVASWRFLGLVLLKMERKVAECISA